MHTRRTRLLWAGFLVGSFVFLVMVPLLWEVAF
jgi:hypothetical protein